MAYAKIDDLYDDKRKVRRAWRAFPPNPVGLHVMAITYCQRHMLDGRLPDDWLEEMVPKARERAQLVQAMLDGGLLDELPHADGMYCVHDFLDWNESAAVRRARSEAARKAAGSRYGTANRSAERSADR